MNTRTFFKSLFALPLIGCRIPVVGNSPEEIEHRKHLKDSIKIQDIPEPDKKEVTFKCNGFDVNVFITTNFLLKYDDYHWETNTYGTFYKCVASARNCPTNAGYAYPNIKLARFEHNKIFEKKDIQKEWDNFVGKLIHKLIFEEDQIPNFTESMTIPKFVI